MTARQPKEPRILEIFRCLDCPYLKHGIDCVKLKQYIIEPELDKIPGSCPLPHSRPHPAPAADTSVSQQRIEQVVEELERREAEADKSGYTQWPQCALIHSISYSDAIALLHGEQGGGSG